MTKPLLILLALAGFASAVPSRAKTLIHAGEVAFRRQSELLE